MQSRMFIHATNVHQGGGRALLGALLKAHTGSYAKFALLDSRMLLPEGMPDGVQIKRVKPSLIERLKAERWLADNVRPEDVVLCFGNLPPLFKLSGRTVVFIQNRYLIDDVGLDDFPLKIRARLGMERLWLASKIGNADEFVVQTPTMKSLLERRVQGKKPVRILPFMTGPDGYARSGSPAAVQARENFDFLYVATGEPHKNHRRLFEAWRLLAGDGLFPSLRLTLDEHRFPALCRDIDELRQQGLKLTNMGTLPHNDVLALYKTVDALIYPSTFESFGLPLIEARQSGLPVLAPELDYVRDVLDPEQTFDAGSAQSIARAVKRFMGQEEPSLPLQDAAAFIKGVLGKVE